MTSRAFHTHHSPHDTGSGPHDGWIWVIGSPSPPVQSPVSSLQCHVHLLRHAKGSLSRAKPASYWTRSDELAQVCRPGLATLGQVLKQVRSESGRVPGLVRSPGRYTICRGTSRVAAGYKQGQLLLRLALAVVSDRTSSATKHRSGRGSSLA
jgi:hypothetical protein